MNLSSQARRLSDAFTLIEAILALAISAVVLAGIGGAFYSALRLRERTAAAVDESLPLCRALDVLKRDLNGTLPPGGVMTGNFINGALQMGSGLSQGNGLQFSSTTGVIRDGEPWGDVQEIIYELRTTSQRGDRGGQDLVRNVSRNLLSTMGPEMRDEVLLSHVERFEVECYDGYQWQTAWDTTMNQTNLPVAVRVRLQQTPEPGMNSRDFQPFELVVPLIIKARMAGTNTAGAA
jgi:type II secretion system protein J